MSNDQPQQPPAQTGAMVLRQQFLERAPELLPVGLSAERMISVAIKCIAGNEALQRCSRDSLLKSCLQAAELGLEPGGALGECYLVPFKGECTLIIGYKGLIGLARRSGEIASIEAHVVHENDAFRYVLGMSPIIEHEPCIIEDPGDMVGVYAIAFLRGGGKQAEFMRWDEVDRIRKGSKARDSMPWRDHFPEMARKTVVRRLAKYLPTSVHLSKGLEFDQDVIEVESKPARARPKSLKERAQEHAAPASPPEFDDSDAASETPSST